MKRALAEKTLKEYLDSNYTKYEENCNEITIHTDRLCVYVTSDEIVGPHVRVNGKNYYFIRRENCPKYATDLWTDETVTLPCNTKTYVADGDSVCERSFYSDLDISRQKRKGSDGRWTIYGRFLCVSNPRSEKLKQVLRQYAHFECERVNYVMCTFSQLGRDVAFDKSHGWMQYKENITVPADCRLVGNERLQSWDNLAGQVIRQYLYSKNIDYVPLRLQITDVNGKKRKLLVPCIHDNKSEDKWTHVTSQDWLYKRDIDENSRLYYEAK